MSIKCSGICFFFHSEHLTNGNVHKVTKIGIEVQSIHLLS